MTRTSTSRSVRSREPAKICTIVQYKCPTRPTHSARTASRCRTQPTRPAGRGERPQGNARRLLLLQTTLRLIADEGIDAVSHRSVAEAAGVPLGSTTYWFSSRQDMLRQALEYFARLEIEGFREHLAPVLGRRLSKPGWSTSSRAACASARAGPLAYGRPVRVHAGGGPPAGARTDLPRMDAWHGRRRWRRSSLRSGPPTPSSRRACSWRCSTACSWSSWPPRRGPENNVIRPALRAWFDRVPRRQHEAAAAVGRCSPPAWSLALALPHAAGTGGERRAPDPSPRRRASPAAISRSRTGRSTSTRRRSRSSSRRRASRPLHRGHQQLRRVLRQDAAAARQGESGGRSLMVATDWLARRCTTSATSSGSTRRRCAGPLAPEPDDQGERDPTHDFSIPWQGGMTGLIVNKKLAPDVHSVNDIFDPKYKGKVEIVTEMREVVPLVMKAEGITPTRPPPRTGSTDRQAQAGGRSGQIRRFTGGDYAKDLVDGNAVAVIGWAADAIQLRPTTRYPVGHARAGLHAVVGRLGHPGRRTQPDRGLQVDQLHLRARAPGADRRLDERHHPGERASSRSSRRPTRRRRRTR